MEIEHFGRTMRGWKCNIKLIYLAQVRDRWLELVNAVKNFQVP